MVRIVVLVALVLAIIVGVVIGCGPRVETAANKVLERIDKVLGELDVKRTDIEQKRREVRKNMQALRDKRIETEVRLEQLQMKQKVSDAELEKNKAKLAKLRDIVAEAVEKGSVERNGKTFTKEDISKSADELKMEYELAVAKVKSFETSVQALQQSVTFLQNQEKTANDMMAKLDNKIAEIDNKKIAVDAVRQASSVAGGDKSISDKINALDKEIGEMFIDVESAIRVEQVKLDELQTVTSSADELLSEPTDLGGVMADIDALLGETKENDQ